MQNRIDALAYELTGKFTLEECSVDEIKHLTRRHPYFAPAQFLLLHKLKQTGSDEAPQQEQKAVLYYHDPLQFSVFISGEGVSNGNGIQQQAPAFKPVEPTYSTGHHIIEDFEEVPTYETEPTSSPDTNDWDTHQINTEPEFIAEVEDQNDSTIVENFTEVNDPNEPDAENLATVDTNLKDEIDSLPQLIEAYRNEKYKPYEGNEDTSQAVESLPEVSFTSTEDFNEPGSEHDASIEKEEEKHTPEVAVHDEIDSLSKLIQTYREGGSSTPYEDKVNHEPTGTYEQEEKWQVPDAGVHGEIDALSKLIKTYREAAPVPFEDNENNKPVTSYPIEEEVYSSEENLYPAQPDETLVEEKIKDETQEDAGLQSEIDSLPQLIESYRKDNQIPESGEVVDKVEEETEKPFDEVSSSEQNFHETEITAEQPVAEPDTPALASVQKEEVDTAPPSTTYHNESSSYGESFFQTTPTSTGFINTESISQPKEQEQQQPVFEAFHTVDYFASQGIKILADDQPRDKLGKQMKSFTEWLKTMKRLPATPLMLSTQSVAEKNVETMATSSVAASDVVTEAMAEVWTKQGAAEKAIEIYKKLSLLDPSKKPYFAAKIDQLKNR